MSKTYLDSSADQSFGGLAQSSIDLKQAKKFKKWSLEENLKYIQFLVETGDKINSEFTRRSFKVFSNMSTFVPNRTPEQCRTHHQKMIQSCGNVAAIIAKILKKQKEHDKPKNIRKRGRKSKENAVVEEPYFIIEEEINMEIEKPEEFHHPVLPIYDCQWNWKAVFNF